MTIESSALPAGLDVVAQGSGPAVGWACHLLAGLGARVRPAGHGAAGPDAAATPVAVVGGVDAGPTQRWAACGGMALTGWPDGPGLLPGVDVAAAADGAVLAFRALLGVAGRWPGAASGPPGAGGPGGTALPEGAAVFGERAALAGLTRQGRTSVGGSTRLLPAGDGWVAIGLRRDDDVELVPALIQARVRDPWADLAAWVAGRGAGEVVERAQLLGLPASAVPARPGGAGGPWPWRITDLGTGRAGGLGPATGRRRPLVVDFSMLWAGPLATSLLAAAGADVVRIEHPQRLDGSRAGPAAFDDLLNAGKLSVLGAPGDAHVARLVEQADLVVTSARPRAVEHLGLAPRAGRSWLTITGYGWQGPRRNWVAYGDDAAVAAGILGGESASPVFCADAVADPLTGLHAAVAALAALIGGRHVHLDVALYGVSAHVAARLPMPTADAAGLVPSAPRARPAAGRAAAPGADGQHPLVSGAGDG